MSDNGQSASPLPKVGLSPGLLSDAFPFHFVCDKYLNIIQAGQGLAKLCGPRRIAGPMHETFVLQRPKVSYDYESLSVKNALLCIFSLASRSDIRLRGQLLVEPEGEILIFVGSPYFQSIDEIKEAGLSLRDFAAHDNTPDLLLLLRANHVALEDAEGLWTKLRQEKDHAHAVLKSIGEGIISTTRDGEVSYMNAIAEQLTGHKMDQVQGRHLEDVLQIVDTTSRKPAIGWADLWPSMSSPVELPQSGVLMHRSGEDIAVEGVITPIIDSTEEFQGLVLAVRNVTEQRNMATLMEYQATHEQLTKLPNRVLLHERAEQAVREARRRKEHIALLFLDLDRFKTINDSLGHHIGDRLLKTVAKRLTETVRDADVVSRLGGDEFVVLLTQVSDVRSLGAVAQKILNALAAPIAVDNQELNISVSIGISVYPEDSRDVEGLLRCADLAMYSAKDGGRNTYRFFEKDLDAAALERMSIENHLRVALEQQQLELYYQPKVGTASGEVVGFEALLRWNHPEKGKISPDRFIPVAEETALILPIGKWVIHEACRQASAWNNEWRHQVPVAVNVSWLQLYHNDLVAIVTDTLEQTGLPPECLELEFTESVLMRNSDSASTALLQLQALGVTLSIDDFGTGYSSLSYLKRFPLDTLKIDRSFIADMNTSAENVSIVEAIVALGQTLGLTIVAEGVEKQGQFETLEKLGCEQLQGYLFSKPMPASQVSAFWEHQRT